MENINELNPVFTELNPEDAASINGGLELKTKSLKRPKPTGRERIKVGVQKTHRFSKWFKGTDYGQDGDIEKYKFFVTGDERQDVIDFLAAKNYTLVEGGER